MQLHEQIGTRGPDYRVDIERGKIREFARAMSAPLPEFLEGDHPIIPPTFLVCVPYTWGYTMERPRGMAFEGLRHDLSVSLHAEESFVFKGAPLRAGDRLSARGLIENAYEKQGSNGGVLTFLTMLTEYRDMEGHVRAEQRSTSVTTERVPGDAEWQAQIPSYDPVYRELERSGPFSGIVRQRFEQLSVGEGPGPITADPLLKQDIVRFQGVVGEDDPLHHDPEWAHRMGYPSVFALGTHLASLMASYACFWLPASSVRAFRVRFKDVCWPGERLRYDGKVLELDAEARHAQIYLTCERDDGSLVNEAWANYDFSENVEGA